MITVPPSAVLAQWISDNTIRTIGTDLFVSLMPEAPDECLACFDTAGIRDGRDMATGEDVRHYGVMIQARSLDYPSMYSELASLVNDLNEHVSSTISVGGTNVTLSAVMITSGPFFIGSSEVTNASMFTLNLLASIGE